MQTTDPTLIFQSAAQLAAAAKRERKLLAAEKVGEPIKVSCKILDLVVRGQTAWTGESGWQARSLDLTTGKTRMLYKGHKGPVTSVALYEVPGDKPWLALITGSWDKTARVWDAETGDEVAMLDAHSDFVKSVTVLPTSPALLVTTSSDRTFRVWDLSPLSERKAPRSIQTVKDHTRPVEKTAVALSEDGSSVTVWTADSLGAIKQWSVQQAVQSTEAPLKFVQDLPSHETSVHGLAVSSDGLWSASADNTAKLHGPTKATLEHPSYVKAVLPNPHGLPYVLTGGEDEEIRVWDANVLEKGVKPVSIVSGHCAPISALSSYVRERDGRREIAIVSAGLDATIRQWSVQDLLNPPSLDFASEPEGSSGMTAEEEAELAELMSDED